MSNEQKGVQIWSSTKKVQGTFYFTVFKILNICRVAYDKHVITELSSVFL